MSADSATFRLLRDLRAAAEGDTEVMNGERAETYLRVLAEAELRRATSQPRGSDQRDGYAARLKMVAQVLAFVGALDEGAADQILDDFELALGARQRGQTASVAGWFTRHYATGHHRCHRGPAGALGQGAPLTAERAASWPVRDPGRRRVIRRGGTEPLAGGFGACAARVAAAAAPPGKPAGPAYVGSGRSGPISVRPRAGVPPDRAVLGPAAVPLAAGHEPAARREPDRHADVYGSITSRCRPGNIPGP